MHVPVADLPAPLRAALKTANYHRRDVEIQASETVSTTGGGGNGRRGGAMAVNLATGEVSGPHWGAWGGSNMFGANAIDDAGPHAIPPNTVAVTLTMGGGHPVIARCYARPETLAPMLPAGPEVTERQATILAVYKTIKGGHRREYLPGVTDDEITALVDAGFLKRNKAGATRITTAGKNAAGSDAYALRRW